VMRILTRERAGPGRAPADLAALRRRVAVSVTVPAGAESADEKHATSEMHANMIQEVDGF
jgi:hypothetical protein